jgi:hypothetical protein
MELKKCIPIHKFKKCSSRNHKNGKTIPIFNILHLLRKLLGRGRE